MYIKCKYLKSRGIFDPLTCKTDLIIPICNFMITAIVFEKLLNSTADSEYTHRDL